jgi:hypothetical protein
MKEERLESRCAQKKRETEVARVKRQRLAGLQHKEEFGLDAIKRFKAHGFAAKCVRIRSQKPDDE